MPREPPVMSAALPASEIIKPPKLETRKSKPADRNSKKPPVLVVQGGCARGLHQRAEKRRGEGVAGHPFGMPLHADDPVFMRLMLDGFDHTIGGQRSDSQAVPQIPAGLVMRGVYPDVESAFAFR